MNKERYARLTPEQKANHFAKSVAWQRENKVKRAAAVKKTYDENKELFHSRWNDYYDRNKELFAFRRRAKTIKIKAQRLANKAISTGQLVREPCIHCKNISVEAHHNSYVGGKELEVNWLCRAHHKAWHRLFVADI